MWKMFGRRNRETNVSPSLSSSTSEPTTPTSSASDEGDEGGEIDWSELRETHAACLDKRVQIETAVET